MKNIKKGIAILGLWMMSNLLLAQTTTLNEHIGVNITFSTTDNYLNADAISNNFREFNAWRNATYGAGYTFENTSQRFPQNWPTKANSNIPQTNRYKYNFDPNYGKMYQILSKNGNNIFPAFTTMHQYLTTNAIVDSYTGLARDAGYSSKQCLQRKPVPHVFDTLNHKLILAQNESYTNPNSYRFFGEYVGYMSLVFGENDLDITKSELYLDGDEYPYVGKNEMKYIEYFNEPDAWWTWSSLEGYFQPRELATAVSVAYDGHGETVKTDIYGDNESNPTYPEFECGSFAHAPNLKIVSPGLHEMNLDYLQQFLVDLQEIRTKDQLQPIHFDVFNFHHYSAYGVNDLKNLVGNTLSASKIVNASLTSKGKDIKVGEKQVKINTVLLESNITGSSDEKIWIHPELDGYKLRGKKLRKALNDMGADSASEIWVSEWGYPSVVYGTDANYHGITPELAQARWMIRGFMEYQASGEISKSYWHWYKDQLNTDWDNNCGLVDNQEKRKLAWYYLKTLQDEIGDKRFETMHDIDHCGENFAWGYDLDSNFPEKPISMAISCPRIYEYRGQDNENYIDDVWTVWIPSASNLIPASKRLYLDEIMDEQFAKQFPKSYSIVRPNIQIDASKSGKLSVQLDEEHRAYIEPNISDEPIFIHFYKDGITTGIAPVNQPISINLYPNPATAEIHVEIDNDKKGVEVIISDVMGKVVWSDRMNTNEIEHTINIQDLSAGIYFCNVILLDGGRAMTKFVVSR